MIGIENSRTTKQAIVEWGKGLEDTHQSKAKHQNTIAYWRKLLKEANIDPDSIERETRDGNDSTGER